MASSTSPRSSRRFSLLALLLSLGIGIGSAGCNDGGGGGSVTFDPAGFLGTWSGTWNNTTFSSSGAVTVVVSAAGGTLTVNVDMDGGVFGGADPAAESFNATFSGTTATLTPQTSTVYGDVTATMNGNGQFTIQGANIPGSVDRFVLTGTWGATTIDGDVTITFDSSTTAAGNATLTKQP